MSDVEKAHGGNIELGGHWSPCDCIPSARLAIIIPFRERYPHLSILLNNLIPFLQYQRKDFRFFVVEQVCMYVMSARDEGGGWILTAYHCIVITMTYAISYVFMYNHFRRIRPFLTVLLL